MLVLGVWPGGETERKQVNRIKWRRHCVFKRKRVKWPRGQQTRQGLPKWGMPWCLRVRTHIFPYMLPSSFTPPWQVQGSSCLSLAPYPLLYHTTLAGRCSMTRWTGLCANDWLSPTKSLLLSLTKTMCLGIFSFSRLTYTQWYRPEFFFLRKASEPVATPVF